MTDLRQTPPVPTVGLRGITGKTYLTLSAVGELDPQPDRSATEREKFALRGSHSVSEPVTVITAELRRIQTARARGAHRTARRHLDRLIDFVWFSGPEDAS